MAESDSSKACVCCGVVKPLTDYREFSLGRYLSRCKRCSELYRDKSPAALARRNAGKKASRLRASAERKAEIAAYCAAYQQTHKEAIKVAASKWRERNADRIKGRYQALSEEIKDKTRAKSRLWREQNRERKAKANRLWADKNKEKMQQYFRKSKDKRRSDPVHRLYAFELGGAELSIIRECWGLTNLRPLPALENASKGGKRAFLI